MTADATHPKGAQMKGEARRFPGAKRQFVMNLLAGLWPFSYLSDQRPAPPPPSGFGRKKKVASADMRVIVNNPMHRQAIENRAGGKFSDPAVQRIVQQLTNHERNQWARAKSKASPKGYDLNFLKRLKEGRP